MIHPASLEDIDRDRDERRRSIYESKFGKYPVLDDAGSISEDLVRSVGKPTRPQDLVDNRLLYALLKNAVHFLVTEDLGIHRKARRLGLSERTLLISDAASFLRRQYEKYVPEHLTIKHFEIHNLNLKAAFFDSLRSDYEGFNDWFAEKSLTGRMCWSWVDGSGDTKALLIYAEKQKRILRETPEKVLKICTFKIDDSAKGLKVGELLLRICFEYCVENAVATAYLTIFEKHIGLRLILEDLGFETIAVTSSGELVYAKDFKAPKSLEKINAFDFCKRFYPRYYDGIETNKFVVPILPHFQARLLGDARREQKMIDEFGNLVIEQNTIKKAYICRSRTKMVKPGDVLLFYRSRQNQGITGVGVVESVLRGLEPLYALTSFVGPRSVYSRKELADLANGNVLAILFRYVGASEFIPWKRLYDQGVLKGRPQTVVRINEDAYARLRKDVNRWSTY
jgi:hypothetical protein